MDQIIKTKIILFGIGSEYADEFVQTLPMGLGEPKIAFSIGFQQAVELLRMSGVISLDDVHKFIHLREKGMGKQLTDFKS